nr:Holo-[acyl-carrier-protein] synthase [Chlamydiota bacterium]
MKNSNIIQGLGTDIIEIDRIKKAIEKHGDRFLERLFTDQELAYCRRTSDPTPHFSGRFAAKEAVLK